MKGAEIFDLAGRVAIVTGGSVGLGRQMAEGLAEIGANLVLCGRKKERCLQSVAELEKNVVRVLGLVCDVKDLSRMRSLILPPGAGLVVYDSALKRLCSKRRANNRRKPVSVVGLFA